MTTVLFSLLLLQQDSFNINKLFKDVKWEEIEEIADEDVQEVDNITAVAGVRGAEAEDEILQHLYYLVDTRTRENSLNIPKP